MRRRHFLLTLLNPAAAPLVVALARRPELVRGLGPGFRHYTRAYAPRPTREATIAALETGSFPHAAEGKPRLLRVVEWDGGSLPPAQTLLVTAPHGGIPDDWRETSVRVPLAVRGSGADGGLVTLVDAVRGLPRRESIFSYGRLETPDEWRMVVRGLDKLVVNARMEVTGLFNLGPDPMEENNLASSTGHSLLRDELLAHLRTWIRHTAFRMDPSGLKRR